MLTITCDGCGESVSFLDLAELTRRHGFCTDLCRRMYTGRGRASRPVTHAEIMMKVKRGHREDLGTYFRSKYEANVARFFNFLGLPWEYEPERFVFTGYTTAPVSYTPDFHVVERGKTWVVEVKGHWLGSDRQKLRRLKAQHPDTFSRLWVISKWGKGEKGDRERKLLRGISDDLRITSYSEIARVSHVIPGWE